MNHNYAVGCILDCTLHLAGVYLSIAILSIEEGDVALSRVLTDSVQEVFDGNA